MNRLSRKEPMTMGQAIQEYVRQMKIAAGLNEQLIYAAWDAVSGASAYTVSKYLKNGTLYCSLSSSVVRSRLYPVKDELLSKLNAYLKEDSLFVPDDPRVGFVRQLVLQ